MTRGRHTCRFRPREVWSPWEPSGPLRERRARRVPTCDECGREQPARRPRPPVLAEREAAAPEPSPLLDDAGRAVALAVCAGTGSEGLVLARGLFGALAARGVAGSVAEPWLEQLMRSGLVRLSWRLGAHPELRAVTVLDGAALAELARPGERAARAAAIASARQALEGIDHPVADEVRRALFEEADAIAPDLARALAAVARHAADGDVLAERVFSARHLGSSKALARLREPLEQRLGPLAALGIREGAAVTLLGGAGCVLLGNGARLDLAATAPFIGLSRGTATAIVRLDLPAAGLVAVENLTVFDACCRGEIAELTGAMFVWTAGYPGRGVRSVVEVAAHAGAPVRAWCDLDLDGVRIARTVARWAPGTRFHRMAPEDVRAAPLKIPLSDRARRALDRELAGGSTDALTPTLAALRDSGTWVEQESFLAGASESRNPGRPA